VAPGSSPSAVLRAIPDDSGEAPGQGGRNRRHGPAWEQTWRAISLESALISSSPHPRANRGERGGERVAGPDGVLDDDGQTRVIGPAVASHQQRTVLAPRVRATRSRSNRSRSQSS
jgi:hypothetical protein